MEGTLTTWLYCIIFSLMHFGTLSTTNGNQREAVAKHVPRSTMPFNYDTRATIGKPGIGKRQPISSFEAAQNKAPKRHRKYVSYV